MLYDSAGYSNASSTSYKICFRMFQEILGAFNMAGFSWILSDSLGSFNEFLTIYVRVFGEAEISRKTTHYIAPVK